MRDPIAFKYTTAPANSGDVYPLDTTCRTIATPAAAPGPYRKQWPNGRVFATIKNGNQAVTVTLELLTGNAGTSADWETDTTATSGGVIALVASTTQVISWFPASSDYRIKVTAGGTAPDSLVCDIKVVFDAEAGN